MSASEMMMLEEELAELRAEVERLRKECGQAYLQGVKAGRDAECITERAAVVAWLRSVGSRMSYGSAHEFVLLSVSDAVENGAHCDRREEEG